MVIVSFVLSAAWAVAQPVPMGNVCWQLSPFVDTLTFKVTQRHASEPDYAIRSQWEAANPDGTIAYALSGAGGAALSFDEETFAVALTLNNPSRFFNSQDTCEYHANIVNGPSTGKWYLNCQGPNNIPFPVNGTLTPIECEADVETLGEASLNLAWQLGNPVRFAGESR